MHIHCPLQVEIMGGRDVDAFAEIEVAGQKESADIAWGEAHGAQKGPCESSWIGISQGLVNVLMFHIKYWGYNLN